MAHDWIPRADDDFDALLAQFSAWISLPAHFAAAGLVADDLDPLNTNKDAWTMAFSALNTYLQQGAPLTQAKKDARAASEVVVRQLAEVLRARFKLGKITAAQLLAAGVPPPDTVPSHAGAPTTHPVVTIDANLRLHHTYHWRDEATPGSKAKPAGVKHAELRLAVLPVGQAAPADPAGFPVQIIDPATPNPHDFDAADGGKVAHVVARWIGTRGDAGPWSATVSAAVQP